MLRLPTTTISLSNHDIKEHLDRMDGRRTTVHDELRPMQRERCLQSHSVSKILSELQEQTIQADLFNLDVEDSALSLQNQNVVDDQDINMDILEVLPVIFDDDIKLGDDIAEHVSSGLPSPPENRLATLLAKFESADEDGYISTADHCSLHINSLDTAHPQDTTDYSSPSEQRFDYDRYQSNTRRYFFSVPDKVSSPQEPQDAFGRPNRDSDARSPLIQFHAASCSPERRHTTSLTPRVNPYGIRGLLLSQPARRPKTYRPRIISYSFDESERASAAYEDTQVSDNDNDSAGSRPSTRGRQSLHDELRGSSLQSSKSEISILLSSSEAGDSHRSASTTSQTDEVSDGCSGLYCSSPPFGQPQPLSVVCCRVNSSPGLKIGHESPVHIGSGVIEHVLNGDSNSQSVGSGMRNASPREASQSPSSTGTIRNLVRLPVRLFSTYRSRSPIIRRPRSHTRAQRNASPSTPCNKYQRLRVYNDRISPSIQPQTPEQLPEARHQSRYHPSYTAPAASRYATPYAHRFPRTGNRGARSDSPPGNEIPGFRGRYSGQENTDEEVQFDQAARRLWALQEARRRGGSTDNTPERELNFAADGGDYR